MCPDDGVAVANLLGTTWRWTHEKAKPDPAQTGYKSISSTLRRPNPRRQQQRIVDVTLRVAQASGAHEKKAPHTSARETGLVVDESVSSARCVLSHCSPSAERRTWGPDIQGQSRADFEAGPALRVVLGDVVDLA